MALTEAEELELLELEEAEALQNASQKNSLSPSVQKGFFSRIDEKFKKRDIDLEKASENPNFPGGNAGLMYNAIGQTFQKGLSDVPGEALVSLGRAIPQPIKDFGANVYSDFKASPVGSVVTAPVGAAGYVIGQAAQGFDKFKRNHPTAGLYADSTLGFGNAALSAIPIKGQSIPSRVLSPVVETTKKTVSVPTKNLAKGAVIATTKAANLLDDITTKVAQGISETVNRTGLPKNLKSLPDAELLFIKTLADEGVGIDDALASLAEARKLKVTPSVSVSANIPQMQTQGYLMSRGSAGSKVAAEAVEDITKNQIPKMNDELIKIASGGNKSAEQYGQEVFRAAKAAVDKKKVMLKKRAKPYYQASVGLDKSVPIDVAFKNVMANPLAVEALERYRSDPFTLTNVKSSLADFGVDAVDLDKLPLNSTISLHGARVYLRQLNDAAFRAGEIQKMSAIKKALNDIDEAIETSFPSYKTARAIYSEDAGALRALNDSPIGQMAKYSDADYSKIANDLMTKDPQFIKKTMAAFKKTGASSQKITDSVAGAFLKRKLEESAKNGIRFGDAVFKNKGSRERLIALVGEEKFLKMQKVNDIIEQLLVTKNIPSQSITAAAQSIKQGVSVPVDKAGVFNMVRQKIAPSLFELVQNNPQQAARYNQLLFTDDGAELLEKISKGTDSKWYDIDAVGTFLNKQINKEKIK